MDSPDAKSLDPEKIGMNQRRHGGEKSADVLTASLTSSMLYAVIQRSSSHA